MVSECIDIQKQRHLVAQVPFRDASGTPIHSAMYMLQRLRVMPTITKILISCLPKEAWQALAMTANWHEDASSLAEVVHELSSCLARTAEQQQLLADAARLLIRGEVLALLCLQQPKSYLMMITLRILRALLWCIQHLAVQSDDTVTMCSTARSPCVHLST